MSTHFNPKKNAVCITGVGTAPTSRLLEYIWDAAHSTINSAYTDVLARMKRLSRFLIVALSLIGFNVHAAAPGDYTDNAVFLSHNYVKYQQFVGLVPDFAWRMGNQYSTATWFPDVGQLKMGADGRVRINEASTELVQVKNLMNAIRREESVQHRNVHAWINIDTGGIDLLSDAVVNDIVEEAMKFVSASSAGSYVYGAEREFDGILFDFEPIGSSTTFDRVKLVVDRLRTALRSAGLSSKKIGVCLHKYGDSSVWFSNATEYYYMARHVDFLVGMTYNSSQTTPVNYQNWMRTQTHEILQSVSGKHWKDMAHPMPSQDVKVYVGFPGFPANPNHDPYAEEVRYAALGVLQGVTDLQQEDDLSSAKYLAGEAMFLHFDGVANNDYAIYAKDWWWLGRYWLKKW